MSVRASILSERGVVAGALAALLALGCGPTAQVHTTGPPRTRHTYTLSQGQVATIRVGDCEVTHIALLGTTPSRPKPTVHIGFMLRDPAGASWVGRCETDGFPLREHADLNCTYHERERLDALEWRARLGFDGNGDLASARAVSGEIEPADYRDPAVAGEGDVLRTALNVSGSGREWRMVRRVRQSLFPRGATQPSIEEHVEPDAVAGVRLLGGTTSFVEPALSPALQSAANLLIATAVVLRSEGDMRAGVPAGGSPGPTDAKITQISLSQTHLCSRYDDGSVRCTGHDGVIEPHVSGAASVAAGAGYACATRIDGDVACWALGDHADSTDVLGWGGVHPIGAAVTVYDASPVRSLALSAMGAAEHSCALMRDGSVRCWGRNDVWFEGRPTTAPILVPDAEDVVQIQVAPRDCDGLVARMNDGTVRTLAAPRDAHCADSVGSVHVQSTADFAVGDGFTVAVLSNGSVRTWGEAMRGDSGGSRAMPGLDGVTQVVAGGHHACALAHGRVWCWSERAEPAVVSGLTDIVQLAANGEATCALAASGAVSCWGRGNALPDLTAEPRLVR